MIQVRSGYVGLEGRIRPDHLTRQGKLFGMIRLTDQNSDGVICVTARGKRADKDAPTGHCGGGSCQIGRSSDTRENDQAGWRDRS